MGYGDEVRRPYEEIPKWLKALGCFSKDKQSWRFNWGTWKKPYSPYIIEIAWKWGLGLFLYQSGDGPHHFGIGIHLIYPSFYIPIPYFRTWKKYGEIFPMWGSHTFDRSIHFSWGGKTKLLHFPFVNTEWGHTEHLLKNMKWYRRTDKARLGDNNWRKEYDFLKANKYIETYPYRYLLRSGKLQTTEATCSVERTVRYYRGLKWLKWPKIEDYCIGIDFKDEVGERSGSWKGGCTGCHYEMKPGERIQDALKRMEGERKFD